MNQVTVNHDGLVEQVTKVGKQCRTCKQHKPFSAFGKFGISRDGYYHDCKQCRATTADYTARRRLANARDNAAATALVNEPTSKGSSVISLLDLITTELEPQEQRRLLRLLTAYLADD